MPDRDRNGATPMSWLHVVGFVLVLWAAASDAMAQVREVVVTELRGNAVRSQGNAPVRTLDTLRTGERVRLSSDSRIGVFSAADAQLYLVDGPAEVTITNGGLLANGKTVEAARMLPAYRGLKAGNADLVQGTLVMRSTEAARVSAPEGIVGPRAGRDFSWTPATGAWRFELALDTGEVIHRASASGGQLTLPPEIELKAGVKYVWGVLPLQGGAAPADWTEFAISPSAIELPPARDATASERLLFAIWVKGQGLERAASRLAARAID